MWCYYEASILDYHRNAVVISSAKSRLVFRIEGEITTDTDS